MGELVTDEEVRWTLMFREIFDPHITGMGELVTDEEARRTLIFENCRSSHHQHGQAYNL
jgi:hypothetical protein